MIILTFTKKGLALSLGNLFWKSHRGLGSNWSHNLLRVKSYYLKTP